MPYLPVSPQDLSGVAPHGSPGPPGRTRWGPWRRPVWWVLTGQETCPRRLCRLPSGSAALRPTGCQLAPQEPEDGLSVIPGPVPESDGRLDDRFISSPPLAWYGGR